jgi:hypothetical protein
MIRSLVAYTAMSIGFFCAIVAGSLAHQAIRWAEVASWFTSNSGLAAVCTLIGGALLVGGGYMLQARAME